MSDPTVAETTEDIYAALQAYNAGPDELVVSLKAALRMRSMKEAVFDLARLAQNNSSARKLMQVYSVGVA